MQLYTLPTQPNIMILQNTLWLYTECRYNAVQYSKISHIWLQDLSQNINQMLDPQKHPITRPNGRRASYGVYFVNICEYWPRFNGTALFVDYEAEYPPGS